jgi:hypothetical protein
VDILGWVSGLPGPVKVTYEAGQSRVSLHAWLRRYLTEGVPGIYIVAEAPEQVVDLIRAAGEVAFVLQTAQLARPRSRCGRRR